MTVRFAPVPFEPQPHQWWYHHTDRLTGEVTFKGPFDSRSQALAEIAMDEEQLPPNREARDMTDETARTDVQQEQARIMAAIHRKVKDQNAHWRAGDESTRLMQAYALGRLGGFNEIAKVIDPGTTVLPMYWQAAVNRLGV